MRGNNVLNVLLKKAVEWEVIGRMPCAIRLLPIPKASATFHDFDDSERLVSAAGTTEPLAMLLCCWAVTRACGAAG